MITPSFGLTATERVLSKLELDFTTASLDSRITFTRTTGASNPATFVNSSGYVTAATNNQPRFDYDPVTLACKGLLIEESKTNSLIYSNTFNDVSWLNAFLTVIAAYGDSPDGTKNSFRLRETTGTAQHFIYRSVALTAGQQTLSVYAKPSGRDWITLYLGQSGLSAYFNVATGVVGAVGSGVTATISASANGFYRCSISANITVSTAITRGIYVAETNGNNTYAGDTTKGVEIYGAQLEAGAFATSYIPTTSAALTRNADVATITGTNFSSFWQASKGGAQVKAIPSIVSGIRPLVQYDDGTADNIIALRGNAANPELQIVDGGAPQVQLDAGTIVANTDYSLTAWWATNDCKARLNSGAVVTDTSATIPTVTQARLGSDGTNYLNGHLATINYYDTFSGQIYTRRKNKAVFSLF